MSEATQEGIVMMLLLTGSIIAWGIWMVRMIRRWADEEVRWKTRQQQIMRMEQQRLEARNIRKHH